MRHILKRADFSTNAKACSFLIAKVLGIIFLKLLYLLSFRLKSKNDSTFLPYIVKICYHFFVVHYFTAILLFFCLKHELLLCHLNLRCNHCIGFFSPGMLSLQILHSISKTCCNQIKHIYIVKSVIN